MPDKGKIMSQTYCERQSKLLNLYQELYHRKEMNDSETIAALRMIGFSETIAANRVREWAENFLDIKLDTERAKKLRLKERASLERYVLQMQLGKKYFLRLKFKRRELTKNETVEKLKKVGCEDGVAIELVNEWETQK